jgi:hypothetical protein
MEAELDLSSHGVPASRVPLPLESNGCPARAERVADTPSAPDSHSYEDLRSFENQFFFCQSACPQALASPVTIE